MISSCRLFRYSLPLAAPLPLAGGVIHERSGLLVRVESDAGACGWGDVAPLPGFSRESLEEAEAELRAWAGRLRNAGAPWHAGLGPLGNDLARGNDLAQPRDDVARGDDLESWAGVGPGLREAVSPSVRFGLETALAGLSQQMEQGAAAGLACFDGAVPVNGLLAGSRERVLADARRLRDEGCRAVKLKVGGRTMAEDVELTGEVRSVIGDGVGLRLDANRSWSLEQAVGFGRQAGGAGVEYLEEPLREPARLRELFEATGIPVALDESLLELEPDDLDGRPEVGAVVLKPTLLGGVARAREWVAKARAMNVRPVVSSCFESGVGLLALAALAWTSTGGAVPAGLDTYRWLDADVIEPRLPFHPGAIEWSGALAQGHRIDTSRLSEIRHD